MTIWPGRTQRSIASGFAAASVSGNRTLRSVGRAGGAYRTAWRRSGGAYCTAWRLPWAPPRPPLLSPRAKENLPFFMLPDQLKKWEAITVEKPPHARCAASYALLTHGTPCACPTAAANRCSEAGACCNDSSQNRLQECPVARLGEEGIVAILVVEDWSGIVGNGNVRGTIFAVFDSHLRRGAQRIAVEFNGTIGIDDKCYWSIAT